MLKNIHWLGHASFRIEGEKVIYIDPWQLKGGPPADLILITHDHYDHFDKGDVARISQDGTVVITTASVASQLSGDVRAVKAGDTVTVEDIRVEVVPAYNINKQFHPRAAGGVGFIVTVGGQRIYHAGDTDLIPEMAQIKADVALLPVGGKYTMTATEAAEAANTIKPQVAVPMHWGTIVGSRSDAEKFKTLCQVPVQILDKER